MEVQFKRFGCLDGIGCVFSLGLLPLMLWLAKRQTPVTLTDQEMILNNGKSIPWDQFTSMKATQMYYKARMGSKGAYMGTRFTLKHTNGTLKFGTGRMTNEPAVVQFIMSHLPENIVKR